MTVRQDRRLKVSVSADTQTSLVRRVLTVRVRETGKLASASSLAAGDRVRFFSTSGSDSSADVLRALNETLYLELEISDTRRVSMRLSNVADGFGYRRVLGINYLIN